MKKNENEQQIYENKKYENKKWKKNMKMNMMLKKLTKNETI